MERRAVVIVGAGPGGAGTALFLERLAPDLAREALVLEKARHPRPKVCAGGLIPHALELLEELEVGLRVPFVRIDGAVVTTPRGRRVEHHESDLCRVIRRDEFDASLVRACRERGVEVAEEEPVLDLRRESGGVRITTGRREIFARIVVAADGSGSIVRRRLMDGVAGRVAQGIMADVPVSRESPGLGIYAFDFRQIAAGLPGYRWAFPCLIEGAPHENVGIYCPAPSGRRAKAALERYLEERGTGEARLRAFPIHAPRVPVALAAPNILAVGDAAGVDPLMGEGISLALEYGRFAAASIREALHRGDFEFRRYQEAVRTSWLGKKLRRLALMARLFYGRGWPFWFAIPEHSTRARVLGLRWYNGVDGWDRRSGWEAVGALVRGRGLRPTAG